ncbi:MAG: glycosyltransferase N-terminal domain-containing protein, partial [Bacteroidota bacterium]
EFEQGRPLIESLKKEHPEYKILLSFFSPSGYQQKKDYELADKVMYLPPDCPANAKYFVNALRPSIAIFIKYEFWYNYLAALRENNIPTVFISSLFREKQVFFRWYGGWFRKKLQSIDHFFVQDKPSAELLKSIGIDQHTVSGDTRFDRVADILKSKPTNQHIEEFCHGNKVVVAGSTWPPDENILTALLKANPALKLIIAPHEIKEERIAQLLNTLNVDAARYTQDAAESWQDKQLLIIDTIGILSSIYRYADLAYIGGAFATGLHNIQEPAVNGIPVIFGPKYHKFSEAIGLVEKGGAFSINTEKELIDIVNVLLSDENKYQSACRVSKQYMLESTGATQKIMDGLSPYL